MKSTHKVVRYDYSKFESDPSWDSPFLQEYEFWGLHPEKGRIHVDTKRYRKACEKMGITEFLPEGLFKVRNTVYFIPERIKRYDYKINRFRDLLNDFRKDWEEEYRPIFKLIRTPSQVQNGYRTEALMYTSSADDFDEIDVDAGLAAYRREPKYREIIQSLYCQFIQKLCTEVDRYTLIVMVECGYKGKDFSFKSFVDFSDGLLGEKSGSKLRDLEKFNAYNLLHKVNNFLKHNSIQAYDDLKHFFPENVCSVEKGTAKVPYENGMFAGDWIILKDKYIDNMFDKLILFFEDYCRVFLKENIAESSWNYDDYFKDAFQELRYLREYFGC